MHPAVTVKISLVSIAFYSALVTYFCGGGPGELWAGNEVGGPVLEKRYITLHVNYGDITLLITRVEGNQR